MPTPDSFWEEANGLKFTEVPDLLDLFYNFFIMLPVNVEGFSNQNKFSQPSIAT
jgi:hypothetical protein